MNVALVIRQRLEQLQLEQRDLATAAQVTKSYISQLLTCKKAPPAPSRTDIYDKMGDFLKLPRGELAKLADLQRREELRRLKRAHRRPRGRLGNLRSRKKGSNSSSESRGRKNQVRFLEFGTPPAPLMAGAGHINVRRAPSDT